MVLSRIHKNLLLHDGSAYLPPSMFSFMVEIGTPGPPQDTWYFSWCGTGTTVKKRNSRNKRSTYRNLKDCRDTAFCYEMGVSGNLWIVVKDVKTLVVYDVE